MQAVAARDGLEFERLRDQVRDDGSPAARQARRRFCPPRRAEVDLQHGLGDKIAVDLEPGFKGQLEEG